MKKLNKNEIALRIVSIVLGIFLWYVVLNTSNPIETKIISIPLEILNQKTLDNASLGQITENTIDHIIVNLSGRKKELESFLPSDIKAYADFSVITGPETTKVDVKVFAHNEKISIISYEPESLEINTEKIIEKSFSVEVVTIGEPAEGYKLVSIVPAPEQISVKGFKSEVDSIDSAVVQFDVSGINKDKALIKYIQFLNDKGEEIQSFSKQFTTEMYATIGKQVFVNVLVEGTAANGFYYKGFDSNALAIYISGPFDVVSKINEVKTRPINIDGLSEDKVFEIEPALANNIQVISVDGELTAQVNIEKFQEKTIIYRKNDILLTEANYIDNIYEVITDSVEVSVKGREDVLNTLLKTDINLLLNVDRLNSGLYKIQIEFEFSKEIEIVGNYNATISITPRVPETTGPVEPEN